VPHYNANITGHGWRKLLRHPAADLPHPHRAAGAAGAAFIQQHAGHDDREAYSTLNMGAGFALFVAAADAERTVAMAQAWASALRVAGAWRPAPSSC
jgi:phosphoribosylformylglycinamidine cyclo-ligase